LGLDEQDSNYFIIDNALLLEYNPDQSELLRKHFFKILLQNSLFVDFDQIYAKHADLIATSKEFKHTKLLKLDMLWRLLWFYGYGIWNMEMEYGFKGDP
jgi:hypothetical protein